MSTFEFSHPESARPIRIGIPYDFSGEPAFRISSGPSGHTISLTPEMAGRLLTALHSATTRWDTSRNIDLPLKSIETVI